MLVLSTAHVTFPTCNRLAEWGYDNEYGGFVYVPADFEPQPDQPAEYPDDLIACFRKARALQCAWVKFDRDGNTLDELPTYEW